MLARKVLLDTCGGTQKGRPRRLGSTRGPDSGGPDDASSQIAVTVKGRVCRRAESTGGLQVVSNDF